MSKIIITLRHETNRISKLRYVRNVESERPRAPLSSPTFFPRSRVRFSVTRDSGRTCVIRILGRVYTRGRVPGNELNSSQEFMTHRIPPFIKSIEMCSRTRVNNRESLYCNVTRASLRKRVILQ